MVVPWLFLLHIGLLTRAQELPNIVFILADDLGWNDVSFHGSDQIPTPNIDALAYDGIILNNYYVEPACTPSRAALLTGRYSIHTGMQDTFVANIDDFGLSLGEKLLPEFLQESGYITHIVGKWNLGDSDEAYTPTHRGFSSHYGFYSIRTDYFKQITWQGFQNGADPVFDFWRDGKEDRSSVGFYKTDLFTTEAERIITNHDQSQVAMMSALDDSVEKVVEALAQKGILNNTVIIFSSDNGGDPTRSTGSNAPLRGRKQSLFEGGTRAPAFVWSPLLEKSGYISNHLIHISDWLPTILSLVGYNLDEEENDNLDGVDMWDTLSLNLPNSPRTEVFYSFEGGMVALRVGDLKLIQGNQGSSTDWYGDKRSPLDGPTSQQLFHTDIPDIVQRTLDRDTQTLSQPIVVECGSRREDPLTECEPEVAPCLFDLSEDPCEFNNLANTRTQDVERMLERLESYILSSTSSQSLSAR